jgi:hypothetical protein
MSMQMQSLRDDELRLVRACVVRLIDRYNRSLAQTVSVQEPSSSVANGIARLGQFCVYTMFFLWLFTKASDAVDWHQLGAAMVAAALLVVVGHRLVRSHTDSALNIFKDPELAAMAAALNGATESIRLAPLAASDGDALIQRIAQSLRAPCKYAWSFDFTADAIGVNPVIAVIAHLQTESILARAQTV